jgi:NitT/TauT family transport system permease protein
MPRFADAPQRRWQWQWRWEALNDFAFIPLIPAKAGIQNEARGKRGDERNLHQSSGFAMKRRATPRDRSEDALRIALPIVVLALSLAIWELVVRIENVPPYVLPAPGLILQTLVADWTVLSRSLLVTLVTTFEGFLLAAAGGVGLALLFNQSRLVEYSLYPYAVILQVTPIVAIAPLLLIYLPQHAAVLACAWIVAFFPVLANTTLGLNSVDRNLADLFTLYGASRRQILWRLKLPSALPYVLGGLRIAGGLSLIGAVVAEIAAGSAGAGSGLAYRIVESGYRLNIPRMFAALLLLSLAGIAIFYLLSLLNHLALRHWHESALAAER